MSKGFRNIGFTKIPADWESLSLGDKNIKPVVNIRNGLSERQDKESGEYRITRIETISNGFIDLHKTGFVSNISKDKAEKFLVKKGDILFSHINSDIHLGKTAIGNKNYDDLLHGMNLLLFQVNENVLEPEFLNYLFRFYKEIGVFIAICSRAVNQSSINQAKLKSLHIPVPPLPEQRKIAHILSTLQNVIEKQEQIIKTTTELKKALMQKLFTKGLYGEAQKETEIGLIPESWEIESLGAIVNFRTGKLNANQAKLDGKYPFFTCSQETYWIDHYDFDIEAILLSGNNARAIYSVKHYKGKFNAYQRTYVITIKNNNEFSYMFLKHALSHNLENLRRISIGTSTKYLTLGLLQNLKICKPPFDEQNEIANVLDKIDIKIECAKKRKENFSKLFGSMLDRLMTGQIRVKDIEFEDEKEALTA